ncbi:hypothetical protein SpCBS45565_g06679 [Spizellomyces sp. 'palustris']|nr:hypothetical protein SpCBS45565_g06679 [Spizellomyces sp. 'palustris']
MPGLLSFYDSDADTDEEAIVLRHFTESHDTLERPQNRCAKDIQQEQDMGEDKRQCSEPAPSSAQCLPQSAIPISPLRGPEELIKPYFPHANTPSTKAALRLSSDKEVPDAVPPGINQYLRDYQRDGVRFMYDLYVRNKGGILCDDMGLGKTVQVIALFAAILGKTGNADDQHMRIRALRMNDDANLIRNLIVAPSSVIYNWKRELDTWGYFAVGIFHGTKKDEVLEKAAKGYYEVILTSFDTCRNNWKAIDEIEWTLLVVDEAHKLKDDKAAITRIMRGMRVRCRLGLTSTAIQNKYKELWCLLDWCNPVGSLRDWETNISHILRQGQSFNASKRELALARDTAIKLKERILSKWMLRRTKALIAHQLPKKEDLVVFCPLTDTQRIVYDRILKSADFELLVRKNDPCDCEAGRELRTPRAKCCYQQNGEGVHWRFLVLPGLITLQKISNHLALIMPHADDLKEKRQKDEELMRIGFPNDWKSRKPGFREYSDPENCGKWKILEKLLANWQKHGCKVLLFSYSVRLLDMLEKLMYTAGYDYCRLDGKTPVAQRLNVVDEFNCNPEKFVFPISTRAGGVGLNLTSANIGLVVFDPNWNPSHDLQAQDRAFLIGQRRDVKVYRLIAAGSLEELVYGRQLYKQQQANIGYTASKERRYFEGVMGDPSQTGELFGIENLFALQRESDIITKLIVKRTEKAEIQFEVADLHVDHIRQADSNDGEMMREDTKDDEEALADQMCGIQGGDDEIVRQSRIERDTVAAILDECGIAYTHVNDDIIGSSKIEEKISSHARKAVEMHMNTQDHAFHPDIFNHEMHLQETVKCGNMASRVPTVEESGIQTIVR